ncbi:DUF998 domain-containing protein [Rhodococcus sp. IEGM 248]|uniref:DUF998 domain-containing protein n=1 Tax=Rhodococcus opacus TaxID=37919 RepID=UPI0013C1E044|nr:DUF998 domain-containing protein [Rhodococcus opacus]MDV7082924.1 DUF998 domain-containing protein [Rhodococcus opacus]NDV03074.1 DUF998 domain-containing protein [Rhodococcus sp. IEGM 248]
MVTTSVLVSRSDFQRWAARAGAAGPLVFTAGFVAQEAVLRDDYSPIADPISALEADPSGWIQQLNFLAFAALLLIFAAGLQRGIAATRFGWAGPALLGAAAVGLVLAAVFPLVEDATGNAYDPGNHVIAGITFFSCSALALLVLSRRFAADPRWRGLARYVGVAGVVGLGCFVMLGRFAMPEDAPLHDVAGLLQRFTLLAVTFPALLTVALRLRRLAGRPPALIRS